MASNSGKRPRGLSGIPAVFGVSCWRPCYFWCLLLASLLFLVSLAGVPDDSEVSTVIQLNSCLLLLAFLLFLILSLLLASPLQYCLCPCFRSSVLAVPANSGVSSLADVFSYSKIRMLEYRTSAKRKDNFIGYRTTFRNYRNSVGHLIYQALG